MTPSPFTTITVCLEFNPFILRDFAILSRGAREATFCCSVFWISTGRSGGGGNLGGRGTIFSSTGFDESGKIGTGSG